MLISAIKKNRIKNLNCCYVGDTYIDYKTAKNAKIDFIFAKYGYETRKMPKKIISINNFNNLRFYIK
jgi:phosphoglycolate phosphatase-like HAD superfamily hydrolase